MALQVWLPLNGNLNNNGFASIQGSGTEEYVDSRFNKSLSLSSRVSFTGLPKLSRFTIMFWAKVDSCSADWADLLGFKSVQASGASAASFRFEATTSSRACSWHNNTPYAISEGTEILIKNKAEWHHVCVSYDGTNIYSYADGVLISTQEGLGGYLTDTFHIGETGNVVGCMSDLRIYDEKLSTQQIKEISKGLMAHYKLAPPGANNLEQNTNCGITDWGKAVGGYFTSSIEEAEWLGVRACKLSLDAGDSSSTSTYRVLAHKGSIFSQILKPDTQYTISFDTDRKVWGAASIEMTNATHDLSVTQDNNPTISTYNNHYHYKYIITTRSADDEGWQYTDQSIYITFSNITGTSVYIANLKLEEGTIDTPWCPHVQDELYTRFNYGTLINEDSSGYLYNTTTQGTIGWGGSTGRYRGSAAFDGLNTNYIYRDRFDWLKPPFTFNCWCNQISRTSQKGSSDTTTLQFVESQGRDCGLAGFSLALSNGTPRLYLGTETDGTYHTINSDVALELDTWHMLTGTYDGTTMKLYVDGVLKSSKAVTTAIDWSQATGFTIGKMAYLHTTTTNYFPFNGYINDVRVYATALSAEDISKLYNRGAYVDEQGYIGAYEFVEVE